jgi:hypothetical protein
MAPSYFSQYKDAQDYLNKTGMQPDQAIEFLDKKLAEVRSESKR